MAQHTQQTLKSPIFPTWCPGCGDFGIWASLKQAIVELALPEEQLVIVYGVGCSGNMADFNRVYGFHALHGRGIANAEAIKLANHDLKVIVIAGDGDTYGEGLNHFLTCVRGNHDVTLIIHDNQVYGLTTGQNSPTMQQGTKTKSSPLGVVDQPVNPLALALSADATFVARGYAGRIPQLTALMKQAIMHEGTSVLDVFQPCVTFNKVNTHQWFQAKVYDLQEQGHNPEDKVAAWTKSWETEGLPIGLFYQNKNAVPYHKQLPQLQQQTLVRQWQPTRNISALLQSFT
jgi:2-oxoglutarate ferredoxin oxidoreductase subunit beta